MNPDLERLRISLKRCRRVLILSCGNPSRADDGVGPWLHRQLHDRIGLKGWQHWIRLQESLQWQPEDALDLNADDVVFFIDADQQAAPPYRLRCVQPDRRPAPGSHGLTPDQLLNVVERIGRPQPLAAWQWGVPAARFELGEGMSDRTRRAAGATLEALMELFSSHGKGGD